MTKPLPTGCIKQNLDTNWRTLNLLLQNVSLDDQIGHLYVVDIEFDHIKATEKRLVYNEIDPLIIEKQKIIDPCERSVYHNVLQQKKEIHDHIEQLKKVMQHCSKNNFNQCI